MTTAIVTYLGDLRTRCEHRQSGNTFITDAPTDNQGRGEAFSPTDTVATALASCMMTIMGIKARDLGLSLEGSQAEVTKVMAAEPRRISGIHVRINLPGSIQDPDRRRLERAAKTCPVHYSLHPELEKTVRFNWGEAGV